MTPLGVDSQSVWNALTSGVSGAGPITLFDAAGFPVRMAAEVKDWHVHDPLTDCRDLAEFPRQTQCAVVAAEQALKTAGVSVDDIPPSRIGVYLGCGEIFPDFQRFAEASSAALADDQWDLASFMDQAEMRCSDRDELTHEPGAAVGLIAGRYGFEGPSTNYTSACVSSTVALGEATELIRGGRADVMLAGGAHSMIHPFGITGFHRLSALSQRNDDPQHASRPFDRTRDGFVCGEGGVVLMLEELAHAQRRGAHILCELSGYGSAHDAFRITDPHPDATSAARSIRSALADAGLNPADLDYINAHGSGTVANDKCETVALKKALGEAAYRIPASSTKSMTGHLTTACGALETFVCAQAIHTGVLPPTINYSTPDPACDLNYVPNQAIEKECHHALNNNSGFGGQNVAIVLSRFD